MIEVSVKKRYGERTVLDVEKLILEDGRVYAVMGSNGSGKSTLARILAGVSKGEGGIIYSAAKPKTGYMPQKSFAFDMSVTANMLLGHAFGTRFRYKTKALTLLDDFLLTRMRRKNAKKLSGGETEKMALARLMMEDYALLVLDEPTAAMDVNATETAEKLLKRYFDRLKPTVVIVTHSPAQAGRIADEIIFLDEGKIAEKGPSEKLLSDPESEKLKRFLSVNR